MSQPYYGRGMDEPNPGSVKRARERALAGNLPPRRPPKNDVELGESPTGELSPPPRRHMPTAQMPKQQETFFLAEPVQRPPQSTLRAAPRHGKARMPPVADTRGGPVISRPTQAPHWPLPPNSPLRVTNPDSNRPGHSQSRQPPPRPQRPSRIPSMLDQSRPQQPTPIFLNPQDYQDEQRESILSQNVSTPGTNASSRLTTSSVGTIPDFPVPTASSANVPPLQPAPPPPMPTTPRRSANLGPPPTTRRGASSHYSMTSNVSPIPEESLRTAESYASSFAMPSNWNVGSAASSPNYAGDAYYDDSPTTAKSRDSYDSGDEIKLVRSASIGKKGKAALIDTKPLNIQQRPVRPSASPAPGSFNSGTGYVDASTSSSEHTLPHKYHKGSTDSAMNEPNATASKNVPPVPDIARSGEAGPSEMPASRIPVTAQATASSSSAAATAAAPTKRPPKLDIDAVRKAEARGSLTSLPDLIKRATRLVAIMDTGKRPASRLDDLSTFMEKSENNEGKSISCEMKRTDS